MSFVINPYMHQPPLVWDAFKDFYLAPTATGWTGATVPSEQGTAWGYYAANVNGFGFPTQIGSYFTVQGSGSGTQNLYRYSSYSPLGNSGFFFNRTTWNSIGGKGLPAYRDNQGWGTSIAWYENPWFSGAPGLSQGLNNLIYMQGVYLSSGASEGIGTVLAWKAPHSGTFSFNGSLVSANQPGNSLSVAVVDSLGFTPVARSSVPNNTLVPFSFSRTYTAGAVVQLQVASNADLYGNAAGVRLTVTYLG